MGTGAVGVLAINAALRRVPVSAAWVLGAVPLAWLVWQGAAGALGVDPVKRIEHALGMRALQFLLAALTVSALLRASGVNLMRFRRALGVWAFVYAVLHVLVWLVLDIQLRWPEIARDLTRRPYIMVGMLGLVAMLPLAWTARDSAIRALGALRWRRLHLLAYVAAVAGGVHFILSVKSWPPEPLLYMALILGLVALRLRRAWISATPEKNAAGAKNSLAASAKGD
jgi:sulfoxide reductase heme-binding subunit YedZ